MEIIYKPIKCVEVHEVLQVSGDELLDAVGHGAAAGDFGETVYWADGIAFALYTIPWNELMASEFLNGVTHIHTLLFSKWPTFQQMYEIPQSKIKIVFRNVSDLEYGATIVRFCHEWAAKK